MKQTIDRGLANTERRFKIANRYIFVGGLCVSIASILLLLLDPGILATNTNSFLIAAIALTIISTIYGFLLSFVNWHYLKAAKYGMLFFNLLLYLIVNLGCDNIGVGIMAYGLSIVTIMYEDTRTSNIFSLCLYVLLLLKTGIVLHSTTVPASLKTSFLLSIIVTSVFTFAIIRVSKLNRAFHLASAAIISDKQEEQKHILDEVLYIAQEVQQGSHEVGTIISDLKTSSEQVSQSINEVSLGNQNTCESVEHQILMTQAISDNIQQVVNEVNTVEQAFSSIQEYVKNGMEQMQNLNAQSQLISHKSDSAVRAMETLSAKTQDISSFTDEILKISDQTNLLALNASIEAARAGEAGKGFAVVAEEIRQLSETTRSATEKIMNLIKELNNETQNVSQSVDTTQQAVTRQNDIIAASEEIFSTVQQHVVNTTTTIADIRQASSTLLTSNNAIIDSISQLSAVTEEVSASSEAVSAIAGENSSNTETANSKLDHLLETVHTLDKYMPESITQ